MKKLARVYIQEANWCQNAHVPTFNECMKVSLASCGYLLLATAAMVGMGDSATKKCFDWVSNNPPILQAASVICRLTDDIVGYEVYIYYRLLQYELSLKIFWIIYIYIYLMCRVKRKEEMWLFV